MGIIKWALSSGQCRIVCRSELYLVRIVNFTDVSDIDVLGFLGQDKGSFTITANFKNNLEGKIFS